jgi:rhamnosyltransferase
LEYTEIIAVVVSYNGSSDLKKTILALDNKVGHIHIVDNASDEETIVILKELENKNNISITYLSSNNGIGYALNLGIEIGNKLGYKWLLTMDQDSIIDDNMINEFCKAIIHDKELSCLTPMISIFDNGSTFNNYRGDKNFVKYAITSGNLVKLSVFEIVGFYNEKLFIDCVDFDFSLRVRSAGLSISLIKEARLYHQLGEAHNTPKIISWFYTSHSPLRRYYMYRNWGYIFEKYVTKFPLFVLKSSIIHLLLLIVIPFYDKKPKKSIKYVYYGFRDYFKNVYGPFKIIKL